MAKEYTCPICRQTVWVYDIFSFVQGSPCFKCATSGFNEANKCY
jgi:hypothetical protein